MNETSITEPKVNLTFELCLLGLLALLWGSSYLFIRVALETIPPVTLIALRVIIASVLLTSVVFIRGYKFPTGLGIWANLFVQSALNGFAAWTVLAWGQQFIASGLAAVLNSTTPIFVFFITFFVTKHESLTWYKLAGAVLGIFGVCLIVGVNVLNGLGQQVLGQLAALTGACMYAIGAINGKKFATFPPVVTAASIMILSTIVLVPASFIIDNPTELNPSLNAWMCVVLLSVFSTSCAFLIYFRLLKTLGSMGTTSQGYLRCGVAVILGMIFMGEVVTPTLAIGLLAAVLGVALINLPIKAIMIFFKKAV